MRDDHCISGQGTSQLASRMLWGAISVFLFVVECRADVFSLLNPRLGQLRSEASQLRVDLEALSDLRLGITSDEIGSQFHMVETPPTVAPWTQLDLGRTQPFESVTIVPAVTTLDSDASTYGFPKAFRVDASNEPSFGKYTLLFQSDDDNFDSERGLPIVIPTPNADARYIRITVTQLAQVAQRWTYALGEVMVLQGNRNIARDAFAAMQLAPRIPPKWHPRFLNDGRTPLGPPIIVELPEMDGAYTPEGAPAVDKWMMVDLGEVLTISEVRLHPIHARQGAYYPGYAFPKQFQVEASIDPDFQNALTIFSTDGQPYSNPGNNAVTFSANEQPARYVRINCIETWGAAGQERLGLSEIQVYSADENVALRKEVTIPNVPEDRPANLLTDGYTSYGRLIELPEWVQRWDRLRNLQLNLKRIDSQLMSETRIARTRLAWALAVLFAFGIVAAVSLFVWRRRQRATELTRFRMALAQDLHDEIGSNLAAMARLGEVAELETDPNQAKRDWQSVRHMALECTDSMRETLWLLGGRQDASVSLPERMRQTAHRMLPKVELAWCVENEDEFAGQDSSLNRQLFLAFKEIIANIAKHSRATRVDIRFAVDHGSLSLDVRDNGIGFQGDQESDGMGLRNVRYRIHKIGGRVNVKTDKDNGTQVHLTLPVREKR